MFEAKSFRNFPHKALTKERIETLTNEFYDEYEIQRKLYNEEKAKLHQRISYTQTQTSQ